MSTSGNRNSQLASRSTLKDFTVEEWTISAFSLFQKGTTRARKACWRRWMYREVMYREGCSDRRLWDVFGLQRYLMICSDQVNLGINVGEESVHPKIF